jgi:hypothetical protein
MAFSKSVMSPGGKSGVIFFIFVSNLEGNLYGFLKLSSSPDKLEIFRYLLLGIYYILIYGSDLMKGND